MKLQHSLLAAALLAAVSTSAVAQSTGVVTLGGTIVPSSCTIATDGDVDFGQIDYSSIQNGTNHYLPGDRTVTLTFTCSGPTNFAVRATDNQFGTTNPAQAGQTQWFGLGKSADNTNIGIYDIRPNTPMVDGSASTLIKSGDLSTWVAGTGNLNRSNDGTSGIYFAFGTAVGGVIPATTGSWKFTMTTRIYGRSDLMLTQDAAISGNTTFEIRYL